MTIRKVNILDRIGSLIPGYAGYAKRDNQRLSDKLLREKIANRLEEVENTINKLQKAAAREEVEIDLMVLEELRKSCSALCSKIRYAAYGTSALFDKEQIKENELQEIHQLDELVLIQAEHLVLLTKQNQEVNFLSAAMLSKLKAVEKAFNDRSKFLQFREGV